MGTFGWELSLFTAFRVLARSSCTWDDVETLPAHVIAGDAGNLDLLAR